VAHLSEHRLRMGGVIGVTGHARADMISLRTCGLDV